MDDWEEYKKRRDFRANATEEQINEKARELIDLLIKAEKLARWLDLALPKHMYKQTTINLVLAYIQNSVIYLTATRKQSNG